jgi:hypothetical protein
VDDIEIYRAEHRRLDILIDELDFLLAQDAPPEPLGFLHFRRDFARLLTQHLKREDWILYPKLRASPRAALREIAGRFAEELGDFEVRFAAYGREWTTVRIGEDWAGYLTVTAALMRDLRARIQHEETELYPLLEPVHQH